MSSQGLATKGQFGTRDALLTIPSFNVALLDNPNAVKQTSLVGKFNAKQQRGQDKSFKP